MSEHNLAVKSFSKFNLFSTFLVMYVIFPFRLNFAVRVQYLIYYGVTILFAFFFLADINRTRLDRAVVKTVFAFFILYGCLLFLTYTIPIVRGTNDYSYFSYYIYFLGRFFVIISVAYIGRNAESVAVLYIKATSLYVCISIILLIPPLHNAYSSIVYLADYEQMNELLSSQFYYTRFGLQGFSGFGSTIKCTLSIVLLCFFYVQCKEKKERSILAGYIVVNLLGTFFYGRTGSVISLFIIFFLALYQMFINKRYKMMISIMMVGIILWVFLVQNIESIVRRNYTMLWLFEPVLNIIKNGRLETASTVKLSEMYQNISFDSFIFGDGYYTQNGYYYMRTDVGWMRPLLFFGIIGEVLYYLLYIVLINRLMKSSFASYKIVFLLLFTTALVGFEIKGETLLAFCELLLTMLLGQLLVGKKTKISLKI